MGGLPTGLECFGPFRQEARGPEAGLALLDEIPRDAIESYQPYWATRAHVEQRLGREHEARQSFDTALRLTRDPAVRRYLEHAATATTRRE